MSIKTISALSSSVEARTSNKGTWLRLQIVINTLYDDGNSRDEEVLQFGNHFTDNEAVEKFKESTLFTTIMKAVVRDANYKAWKGHRR